MKKHIPFRAVFLLLLAVVLIGAALWNMLSPQLDRWQSRREYEKMAQDYVSTGSIDDSGGEVYKIGYQPGEEYQEFIDHMIENSQIETGIRPQSTNKILTLSTCVAVDSDERFAVHAVCTDTQTTDAAKLKE